MWQFSRYLLKLKSNVRHKENVEDSICNAYFVENTSLFCSYYFEDHVSTMHRNVPRNDDSCRDLVYEHEGCLSISKHPGRAFGRSNMKFMTDKELEVARIYVLLNCSEIKPFIEYVFKN